MDWLQVIVLALIQGLTEFLPISSSAHLLIPSLITDWEDQGLAFDVAVHFGTLFAVLAYFRRDLLEMIAGVYHTCGHTCFPSVAHFQTTPGGEAAARSVFYLALATLPVAVVGFVGKDLINAHLRTLPIVIVTTIGFAFVLAWSDRVRGLRTEITLSDAVLIGGAQVLALVPGTSRSGITLTAALFLGLSRTAGARFVFLLSIPTILGAQLLLTLDAVQSEASLHWPALCTAIVMSAASAFACIHFFIRLIERTGLMPYVLYRLLLGGVLTLIWIEFF